MKKGITLVAVLTTVIIMLILTSTVTISAFNISNNAKKTKLATELSYIKEAVYNYCNVYNNDYPISESVIVDLSQISSNSLNQFDKEEGYSEKRVVLYVIDKTKLGIKDTVYGNGDVADKDIYALSKETKNVYYIKGVKAGNQTYYTLTEDLSKLISYSDSSISKNNSETTTKKDNVKPVITLGDKQTLISSDEKEKYFFVTVNVEDKDSGVKIAKFEREVMTESDAEIYFKNNGIELQEDVIEFSENTKGLTVYAEDNEGNVSVVSKEF